MPTVRELILAASTLPQGNTHRDHLNNLDAGTKTVQVFAELKVELVADLEVELEPELVAEIESDLEAILEPELTVEVCT